MGTSLEPLLERARAIQREIAEESDVQRARSSFATRVGAHDGHWRPGTWR